MASTSPFAPFANITPFQYLNKSLVDSRVHGIYRLMLAGNYQKAACSITDMYVNLIRAMELDFAPDEYSTIYDAFARMRIEMARGRYANVHTRLRDLHYFIATKEAAEAAAAAMVYEYEIIPWMNDDDSDISDVDSW